MYDVAELEQRFVIIKHTTLDDATILDRNYQYMIRETGDPATINQITTLRSKLQTRIEELTKNNRK